MKNSWLSKIEVLIAMPIVLALVLTGLWLALSAARENIRLSQFSDQIISSVALIRELHIQPNYSADKVKQYFLSRFENAAIAQIVEVRPSFMGRPPEYGFRNAWDNAVSFAFDPVIGYMRIDTRVSAVVCRRLLMLYAKDAGEMGLWGVDTSKGDDGETWEVLYKPDPKDKTSQMEEEAIYDGCGEHGQVSLSLTFAL